MWILSSTMKSPQNTKYQRVNIIETKYSTFIALKQKMLCLLSYYGIPAFLFFVCFYIV